MTIQVSPDDEWLLAAYSWSQNKLGYVQAPSRVEGKRKTVLLHRMIAQAPSGVHVDHIDGDPGNNRRENLRLCTHAQNMKNRRPNKNTETGVKGVTVSAGCLRKYRVEIKADNQRVQVGRFEHLTDAALAYRLAAIHLHGEFARFNHSGA